MRFMIGLFASILLGVLLTGWLSSASSPLAIDPKLATIFVGTISFHGMALLLTVFFLREHQIGWSAGFGFSSPRLGRSFSLALIVGVCVLPIVWSLGQLSEKLLNLVQVKTAVQETVQAIHTADSVGLKFSIGLIAILVAPVAEEIIFRGILYPAIKQYGFPRLAFWGTSILFAVIHNNAMILLPLTFLAVILTLLYETTDNLLAPIVTHSLFNLANFYWLVIQDSSR
jgi:membrane protease YdiL (CAAX protease family)